MIVMKELVKLFCLILIVLCGCSSEADEIPIGTKLPIYYSLEIHFVDSTGESLVSDMQHEAEATRKMGNLAFYKSTDVFLHQSDIEDYKLSDSRDRLYVVVTDEGSEHYFFGTTTPPGELHPVIHHALSSPALFGYKEDNRAELVSHWNGDSSAAECTGVIFDGVEFPVSKVALHEYGYEAYKVVITLPDRAD